MADAPDHAHARTGVRQRRGRNTGAAHEADGSAGAQTTQGGTSEVPYPPAASHPADGQAPHQAHAGGGVGEESVGAGGGAAPRGAPAASGVRAAAAAPSGAGAGAGAGARPTAGSGSLPGGGMPPTGDGVGGAGPAGTVPGGAVQTRDVACAAMESVAAAGPFFALGGLAAADEPHKKVCKLVPGDDGDLPPRDAAAVVTGVQDAMGRIERAVKEGDVEQLVEATVRTRWLMSLAALSTSTAATPGALPELAGELVAPDPVPRLSDLVPAADIAELVAVAAPKPLTAPPVESSAGASMLQGLLEGNIFELLVRLLRVPYPRLQLAALWNVINMAGSPEFQQYNQLLVKYKVTDALVPLIASKHAQVAAHAVWAVGNIAADQREACLNTRRLLTTLTTGIGERLLDRQADQGFVRVALWALANMCDLQQSMRSLIDVCNVLPVLASSLYSGDCEVLAHACWCLSHLCEGQSAQSVKLAVAAGVCPRLVTLLTHPAGAVLKPALRCVGNIVCADTDHDFTQHIVQLGAVPWLRRLVTSTTKDVQKEACWTLSNIAAGSVDQIQAVLESGVIPVLVALSLSGTSDPIVTNEACWVILNATSCGSHSQIEYLVEVGCVGVLCNLLMDASMVMIALEGLEKILQVGEDMAPSHGGLNRHAAEVDIARLQQFQQAHKFGAVGRKAARLWKRHFVTCAICNSAFAKHTLQAEFCAECNCFVCSSCDCTVFHLSYQEDLWAKEVEGTSTQKTGKKSKRARKRRKEKEKKAALRAKSGSVDSTGTGASAPAPAPAHKAGSPLKHQVSPRGGGGDGSSGNSSGNGSGNSSGNGSGNGADSGRGSGNASGASTGAEAGAGAGAGATSMGTRTARRAANRGTGAGSATPPQPPAMKRLAHDSAPPPPKLGSPALSIDSQQAEAALHENDDLVSFLQETGSILALAMRMDAEGDDSVAELDPDLVSAKMQAQAAAAAAASASGNGNGNGSGRAPSEKPANGGGKAKRGGSNRRRRR